MESGYVSTMNVVTGLLVQAMEWPTREAAEAAVASFDRPGDPGEMEDRIANYQIVELYI
jgi:hypothetical protein